jgi:hypothetical protein
MRYCTLSMKSTSKASSYYFNLRKKHTKQVNRTWVCIRLSFANAYFQPCIENKVRRRGWDVETPYGLHGESDFPLPFRRSCQCAMNEFAMHSRARRDMAEVFVRARVIFRIHFMFLFVFQSWENVDKSSSGFTLDITPVILAAHKNNYEILKLLIIIRE